ncbi:HIT family protein [Granulicoccus phenolivorans]|uniref:HIT family protein n=1 Tax=Granulicoccus phenolivorans TaxID=266854 RepID=UPI0003FED8D1|nr:HIT family protein [Granulicoccus phenolivorans]
MASVFTRIINGELPGRFVFRNERVVAFLSIGPMSYGHTLVVPIEEVDTWVDADPELWLELSRVAQLVGRAVSRVTGAPRVANLIAGFEVPHLHIHLFGAQDMTGFRLSPDAVIELSDDEMDRACRELRAALRELGETDTVPA